MSDLAQAFPPQALRRQLSQPPSLVLALVLGL
jgi:hypothetical protein